MNDSFINSYNYNGREVDCLFDSSLYNSRYLTLIRYKIEVKYQNKQSKYFYLLKSIDRARSSVRGRCPKSICIEPKKFSFQSARKDYTFSSLHEAEWKEYGRPKEVGHVPIKSEQFKGILPNKDKI